MALVRSTARLASLRRLAILAVALVPAVSAVLVAALWLQAHVPDWVYWKAGLIFAIILELLFVVGAACGVIGALVCALLLLRSGRGGDASVWAGRGLVLCVSTLVSVVIAESAGWVQIEQSRRSSAVPVGGLDPRVPAGPFSRFAAPPSRIDLPQEFPVPRRDHDRDRDIEIVVLGESSAEGVPFQGYLSIGKIVAWRLEQLLAGRSIRLRVLARAGDTLERQHQAMASLERRPDVVIVYCGHNEFFSRLWWSRNLDYYIADRAPGAGRSVLERAERLSAFCRWTHASAEKCRIAIPPDENNTRDLIDVPVYTAVEYGALLADFRRRLDEIVDYTDRLGALAVLILPPGNDAGFEPNRSFLAATTPAGDREAFRQEFIAVRRDESADRAASIDRYRRLLERQPCFAEAHFRLARLLEQAGQWDEAYQHYVAARDFDGMPMRCPSDFQQAYRDVACRHQCALVDGQAYFHRIGRKGLLDDGLFQDAMHPSLRGQIALAQAVLGALHARGAFGWRAAEPAPTIEPVQCTSQFAVGPAAWRSVCLSEEWFSGLVAPLRYDPTRRIQARDAAKAAALRIDAGMSPDALGLPNVGVAAPVPVIAPAEIGTSAEPGPRYSALPWLAAGDGP